MSVTDDIALARAHATIQNAIPYFDFSILDSGSPSLQVTSPSNASVSSPPVSTESPQTPLHNGLDVPFTVEDILAPTARGNQVTKASTCLVSSSSRALPNSVGFEGFNDINSIDELEPHQARILSPPPQRAVSKYTRASNTNKLASSVINTNHVDAITPLTVNHIQQSSPTATGAHTTKYSAVGSRQAKRTK